MRVPKSRIRPIAAGLVLAVGLVVVSPPTQAAQMPTPRDKRSTLAASAEARVAAAGTDTAVAAQQAAAPASESSSFFKSRKGVIALLLFAAGTTFTFVSKSKDRVKSPIRN